MLSISPETTFAILIGASEFSDSGLSPLPSVRNNVMDFARFLVDSDYIGIKEENVIQLLDSPRSRITDKLGEVRRYNIDTLIVYYAGHGILGESTHQLHLATCDTTVVDAEYNAIPIDLVKRAIFDSGARRKILILDCCYSGRAVNIFMADQSSQLQANIEIEGAYAMAAAAPNELALAPLEEKYTAFTGKFLHILEHGLENGNCTLSLEDIFKYIETEFKRRPNLPLPRRANFRDADQLRICRNGNLVACVKLLRHKANYWLDNGKDSLFLLSDEDIVEVEQRLGVCTDILDNTSKEFWIQSKNNRISIRDGKIGILNILTPLLKVISVVFALLLLIGFILSIGKEASSPNNITMQSAVFATVNTGDEDKLNLRISPSTVYTQIDKLNNGDVYLAVGRDYNSRWVKIIKQHPTIIVGWVASRYVTLSAPISQLPVDSVGNIYVRNLCPKPIRLALRYRDLTEIWITGFWWNFEGNQNSYLSDNNGDSIISKNAVFYYFAETIDRDTLMSRRDRYIAIDGNTLPVTEQQLPSNTNGEWILELRCDL